MHSPPSPIPEALAELLFDKVGVGLCLVSPDGRVLRANTMWLRNTGLSVERALGADILELFPDSRDFSAALHARARAGATVTVPPHEVMVSGRVTWWEGSISPVPMDGGNGLLITAREITSRVAAEVAAQRRPGADVRLQPEDMKVVREQLERQVDDARAALRENSSLLQAISDTSADVIYAKDRDGRLRFANPATLRLVGKPLEEVLGKTDLEVLEDKDVARRVMATDRQIMESGVPVEVDEEVPMPDGSPRTWFSRKVPYRDAKGKVVGLLGISRDITERQRSRAELRNTVKQLDIERGKLEAVIRVLPVGIAVADASGATRSMNEAALRMHGFRSQEEMFRELSRYTARFEIRSISGENLPQEEWPVTRALRGEFVRGFEVMLRNLDANTERIASYTAVPIAEPGGKLALMVFVIEDITDRKRADEELRRTNEQLRDADRRKNEFLAVLSHELRNPLAPIRNGVHLLELSAPGSEQSRRAMEVVRRQSDHLARLVDDLLDLTRIERGKVELQRRRVDLLEVVRRTTDDLRSMFDRAGLALRVQTGGPVWVEADSTRIAQVLGNLLHNASKFTEKGGAVNVSLGVRDGQAELTVRDTGLGIDPEQVQRMFEPFVQAEATLARTRGGLGLGLSLVKGLVELHGGTVTARSEGLGRGAEFKVMLPLADAPASAVAGSAPEAQGGREVLVIEDNLDAAHTLADLLELYGHRVRIAHDGRTGISLARELPPQVILCDIGLPDVDGYEVARTLRSDAALRGTRLIALSGYAQPEEQRRAREAGFDAHIAKPPSPEQLMREITRTS